MDPLRFGPLASPTPTGAARGSWPASGGYGNCLGLPNIGGEAVFDATYLGNPLVNALCVGVLRHEDLHLAKATGVGNQVVLYGARTGRRRHRRRQRARVGDVRRRRPAKRPSVQVGDPFMEKLLIECTLELFAAGIVTGIQDLGGAGLSCATSELASAATGGMHVELDRVPLRDSSLAPEEILMSESQERMMAWSSRGRRAALAICAKWDVEAVVVGEVTDTGRLGSTGTASRSSTCHRVRSRTTGRPTTARSSARVAGRPPGRRRRGAATPSQRRRAPRTVLRLVASENLCDKSWITDQYDRYVRGDTVVAQPSDSGMIASTRRPGSASRSPPTATAGSPSSTRTPARSWRSPRPTATSPPWRRPSP
jgi:phosphoribosylformylglycinamidine synthase